MSRGILQNRTPKHIIRTSFGVMFSLLLRKCEALPVKQQVTNCNTQIVIRSAEVMMVVLARLLKRLAYSVKLRSLQCPWISRDGCPGRPRWLSAVKERLRGHREGGPSTTRSGEQGCREPCLAARSRPARGVISGEASRMDRRPSSLHLGAPPWLRGRETSESTSAAAPKAVDWLGCPAGNARDTSRGLTPVPPRTNLQLFVRKHLPRKMCQCQCLMLQGPPELDDLQAPQPLEAHAPF